MPVAVVNRSFWARYFHGADPLAYKLAFARQKPFDSIDVVGIIDDMKQVDLAHDAEPEVYLCASQMTPGTPLYSVATAATELAVRTGTDPENVFSSVRRVVHAVAPDATVREIKTLHEVVEELTGNEELAARLLALFAATALIVSVTGLYGLLQQSVNHRVREIGVRLALGAQPVDVVRLILVHAGRGHWRRVGAWIDVEPSPGTDSSIIPVWVREARVTDDFVCCTGLCRLWVPCHIFSSKASGNY